MLHLKQKYTANARQSLSQTPSRASRWRRFSYASRRRCLTAVISNSASRWRRFSRFGVSHGPTKAPLEDNVPPFAMPPLHLALCGACESCALDVGCLRFGKAKLTSGGGEEVERAELDVAPGGGGRRFWPQHVLMNWPLEWKSHFGTLVVPYLACQLSWF
jgi:hypothetical protein